MEETFQYAIIISMPIEGKKFNLGHRQRSREKFMNAPLRTLLDYEVLEMVLYLAIPRSDTRNLAREMLLKFNSLIGVLNASPSELAEFKGVGDSVVFTMKLLLELFSRLHIPIDSKQFNVLSNFTAVINYCNLTIGYKSKEYFRVLYLNKKNGLIADHVNEEGTVDQIQIYPREIAKKVLEIHASAIVLVHNHPSGDVTPSKEDIDITKTIKQALSTFNVMIHDHIIISKGNYFSFRNNGLI